MEFNFFKRKEKETKRKLDESIVANYGINFYTNDIKSDAVDKISAVSTAHKILTENISRIPIIIKKDGEIVKEHPLYYLLRYSPNNIMNINSLVSAVEYDRNKTGNGFIKLNTNKVSGDIIALEYVPAKCVSKKVKYINGHVYYQLDHTKNTFNNKKTTETINGNNLLHFKQPLTINGFWGIPPTSGLAHNLSIFARALNTLDNYYEHNAHSPLIITSKVQSQAMLDQVKEEAEKFAENNSGAQNAGKMIVAPPNVEISPNDISMIDAQIIETLAFNRDEIASAYGIPNYMMNNSDSSQSIEQQSLQFRNFTISPILSIYRNELNYKLLTKKEISEGYSIDFDSDVLIDSDLVSKTRAYQIQATNGLATHNEVIEKLGNKKINHSNADKHRIQKQYGMIESDMIEEDKKESKDE